MRMIHFGDRLAAWRQSKGLTQADLALQSGIPRPNISAIEKNRRDITLSTLETLAKSLNLKPSQLLEDAPILNQQFNDRHDIDAIARAIVSGETLPDPMLDQAAYFIAGLVKNQLASHQASGAKRFLRVKHPTASARFLSHCLYGPETLNRILKRVRKHLPRETQSH